MPFIKTSLMNLTHLVVDSRHLVRTVLRWLLLVSAWAKRVPFLWAALPPAAIGIVEKMAFNTSYVGVDAAGPPHGRTGLGHCGTGNVTMDMLAPLPWRTS